MILMSGGRRLQDSHLCFALLGSNVNDDEHWCPAVASHYVETVKLDRDGREERAGGNVCVRHAAAVLTSLAGHEYATYRALRVAA